MRLIAFIFLLVSCQYLSAQNLDTKFGKNRVQYHDDFKYWSKYETENFIIYWYGKSRNVAQSAAQLAELDHDEIRKIIEHKVSDKIEILVYVDINDVKQSNIGNDDLLQMQSGETTIVGNKMFVYFDGNHHHLREKIREGIASVYLASMMFGSSFQEILQNAVLLDVPLWYQKGIVSYSGNEWNLLVEDELRDILATDEKYYEFEKLALDHPKIAGHSLWQYIAASYGRSSISNLLYLTKISRDVENSFLFVLNTPLEQIMLEWEEYYFARFSKEQGKFAEDSDGIKLKKRGYVPVSLASIDASDRYLLYNQNNIGKSTLRILDTETGKDQKVFKKGFKNGFQETDFGYPTAVWHPTEPKYTVLYSHRDQLYLRRYEVESEAWEEQLLPNNIQRIYSIDYIDDRYYLFSAALNGLSDLVLYDSKNRQARAITSDYYDDLDAKYTTLDGQPGILWSSNRTVDHILSAKLDSVSPLSDFDLMFLPLKIDDEGLFDLSDNSKVIDRITDTGDQNERHPILHDDKHIVYLSDQSGIINSYVYNLQLEQAYPISNHNRNLITHSLSKMGTYTISKYLDGRYQVYQTKPDLSQSQPIYTSSLVSQVNSTNQQVVNEQEEQKKDIKINPGLYFRSRFDDPEDLEEIEEENSSDKFRSVIYPSSTAENQEEEKKLKFKSSLITAAGLKFKVANLTTRFDNEVLFEGLELADQQTSQRGVNQVPMGFLAKASVMDIFEDHILEGGVRVPTNLNGAEYFLTYDDKKKLIDRKIAIYRRTQTDNVPNPDRIVENKKNTLLGLYQWKLPFDIYRSVSATASFRNDRIFNKSTDDVTFNEPERQEKRIALRLEYIYDNTFDYALNVKHGSRYKVFLEGFNQFNFEFVDGWNINFNRGFTGLLGFDARHYVPVLQHSVFAMRGAGGISFGTRPNLYYLGSVNNSFFNSFNQDVPQRQDIPFAFANNINQLRGFRSNIRNGTRYAVSNFELRVPLFRYLLGKDRGLAFFRNLQIIGFFDAGLAWYGSSPFSEDNPLNAVTINNPVAQIEVEYFRDPLVMGYGWGLRTQILGYYVKVDFARGIETRQVQERLLHFSFGYDF